jgi:hypothetical protein
MLSSAYQRKEDVPADAGLVLVGAQDHRHRVPAGQALDLALQLSISRKRGLLVHGDRVDIRRGARRREIDAVSCGLVT